MAFELHLRDSLRYREGQAALEFAAGDSLETVLSRNLLAVEASADTDLLTSILLLDPEGKRLCHAAAPSLPRVYCEAIDGTEIGPDVGSCGTAAYLGHAIYVTDIETDPLWKDYRHVALPHGLRACWSTPIRDHDGAMIGTFAIYHLTPRGPTQEEVEAIRLITDHVAQAIIWFRAQEDRPHRAANIYRPDPRGSNLRLVSCNDWPRSAAGDGGWNQPGFLSRLEGYAAKLDRFSAMVESEELKLDLETAAQDCRKLIEALRAEQGFLDEDR